jgi:D-amino peptidase
MKFIIAVDCEGVACVVGARGQGIGDSPLWEMVRRQATREANATAKALFDSGATQVIVWDNHASGVNLVYDDLDERCDILLGAGIEHRWQGMDGSFAGVLLVGYHSMDTTIDGVLAHSYSSMTYQHIKINETIVGEIEIDAAMAGAHGVPVIFVASDDKGTAEASRFMPWIETVATKQGLGRNSALSKHPKRAATEIYDGVKRAVSRLQEMKPFNFAQPMVLEFRFKKLEDAEICSRSHHGWERVDAYTCRKKIANLSQEW